jgi:hypothetical protein
MMKPPAQARRRQWIAAMVAAILSCVAPVPAAEVSIELASPEVYVGIPFSLTITIRDYEEFNEGDVPSIPEVPGLNVLGPPSQNTQSSFSNLNGRITQSRSLQLRYSLIAAQPGRYVLPPIAVSVDGQSFTGRPITITASKPEGGDLLRVEVQSEKDAVYLGEPINLTMRIWIKRYEDDEFNVQVESGDTWSLIDMNRSNWGEFVEAIRNVSSQVRRGSIGRTVRREGDDGVEAIYHLYEIPAIVWPRQAGTPAIDPPVVYVEYPTRLERSRDFFSRGQLRIAQTRPVLAAAEMPQVEVKLPPEAGRPPFYAGAVGRFDIGVTAQPTEVAVGDPITITLTVTDVTPGGTQLELLQPPILERVAELQRDFRIPTDPLAGIVQGRVKTFTQTIRAKNEQVQRIPPIPLAFFDPQREAYVTIWSDPIDLDVQSASTLAMADIVGGEAAGGARATELTEVAGGILANHVGADLLLTRQAFTIGPWRIVIIAAPPILFIVTALGRYEVRRLRHDRGYARRRSARRNAMKRLSEARRTSGAAGVAIVAGAMSEYIADRCNLPPGALTGAEVIDHLRTGRVPAGLIEEVESLLRECETRRYGGAAPAGGESITDRAARCIRRLERERIR